MPLIETMTIADYDAVMALLRSSPGLALRTVDSRGATERYLARNPGLSFVARCAKRIVGCVMCGHDGRRGYLQHLAVDPEYQRRGIGTALVERCLAELSRLGIDKAHLDVLVANEPAHQYWTGRGWKRRDDIVRYSYTSSTDTNA
jgi:ribosomal protein S18 acetylase RimI-like enzyme